MEIYATARTGPHRFDHDRKRQYTGHGADTGPGIPVDKLDKVFEGFYRLPTLELESGGTGLGLAITKSLVELHGGSIWAQSTGGEGSQFVFRLPPVPTIQQEPLDTSHCEPE
ncbi:MAG: ATP-binding protein [Nitrospira sp.]|nr:ATP-binding protein [Nitrospira sp.]